MPAHVITPSPHIHTPDRVDRTMLYVVIALTPTTVLGIYFFGLPALWIILTSVISAVFFEVICQRIADKPVTVADGSAALTGLLLALTLPPGVPLWMPVLGAFVAIFAKHIFGGLGHNFLNPALVGRAFLAIFFALPMASGFVEPLTDTVASATPLAIFNMGITPGSADYTTALLGFTSGAIGETAAIALIIGGLLLILTKVITWHIPVTFIGTVYVLALLFHPDGYAFYQLLLGGLLLGAFFMATDYPTSPITPAGKLVFGIGCGIITALFRIFGSFPEGVAYAILTMNLTVPLIDRYIRPRVFGT